MAARLHRGRETHTIYPQLWISLWRSGDREAEILVTEAQHLWTLGSAMLRAQVSDATWRTWFEAVHPVAVENGTLVLAVPSALAKERIEGRYLGLVRDVMSDATGSELPVRFDVQTENRSQDDLSHLGVLGNTAWQDPTMTSAQPEPPKAVQVTEAPLDLPYTFDAFVTGASNRFAHAAALSVAETPAKSYNPLFIHGNAGLGKTHLLHAIGNYVRENFPTRHVRYVSTETFMNEFVDAIRTNTTTSFKRRYRECDVLLVDDIQFMENKEGLQEEFPMRLVDRTVGVLTLFATSPGSLPDDVLEFIAFHVTDNIRELEGALIRVSAFASLNDQPVDQELAQRVLSDIVDSHEPRRITPRVILESTATTFGFSVEELCGTSRRRPLVTARQIGMYVFRELTDYSYPAIAREFGGRDHTTVIHAVEKVSALMKERRQIYDQVTELLHLIRSGG